jgi:hypothetical protein
MGDNASSLYATLDHQYTCTKREKELYMYMEQTIVFRTRFFLFPSSPSRPQR